MIPELSTNATRIYRARIEIPDGDTYYITPINWQATWRYETSTYLSVTFFIPDEDMLDELTTVLGDSPSVLGESPTPMLGDSPISVVTLTIEVGARTGRDPETDSYGDLLSVELETVRSDEGASSYSAQVSGHATYINDSPSEIVLGAGNYQSATLGVFRYRGPVNYAIKPGDRATIAGVSNPVVIGSISYNVNSNNATMEIGELTDSTYLAELGW